MSPQELCSALKECFGDTVAPIHPAAGDPYINVEPSRLRDVCNYLKTESSMAFDFLRLITSVDCGDHFTVVYHLYSYTHHHELTLHVDLKRETPQTQSVVSLWAGADWQEREAFDMMGVVFEGHPDLKRILLPLDWQGFPLRKDYKDPQEYHGIEHG